MAVTRLGLMGLPMIGSDQDVSGKTEQQAGSDTGDWGSGGHGSQTGGTFSTVRRRRGRRGFLVNPWALRKRRGRR